MDALEKDEVPMLSTASIQSDKDVQYRRFTYRLRSASMSIPTSSIESDAIGNNLVGLTGPLRSERKTSYIQMSGPLYAYGRHEDLFRPTTDATGLKNTTPPEEVHLSFNGLGQNDWAVSNSAVKNEHLLRSGQLGICNDPYCTTCPTFYNGQQKKFKTAVVLDPKGEKFAPLYWRIIDLCIRFVLSLLKILCSSISVQIGASMWSKIVWMVVAATFLSKLFHSVLYGDAKGWARRIYSFLHQYTPGVMNPHTKLVQRWNKFFVICCLVAIFLDPLFFFSLSVQQDEKCIVLNWPLTTVLVVFRSMTDFIYLLHILLQFRLAYVAPESRVVGAGDLVDHPKKIALNYLSGYFFLDFFVVLPLPQIIMLLVLPQFIGSSGANYAKNLLRAAILLQYIPRLYRCLPLLVGKSQSGFIFESAWANFVINLLTFVLSGHVVGSCWYLFGLQRVNQCLRDTCHESGIEECTKFIDCGYGNGSEDGRFKSDRTWVTWKNNVNASSCFSQDGFPYGIYVQAVNLTAESSPITRYVYSLFWGFQQISTLAGNQVPSYFIWEVLFTMGIIGLGLLLFALLIGNMQNFLQALGRRRLEMSLRRRDVEQWMSHRRLPENLRRKVREAERYTWAATRGVNEEMLLENLPEDLQVDIRRHLFKFVKKVRIFALMDEPILDAICERLRQRTYIKGSRTLYHGGLVSKMVFIVRGKMESIGEDGNRVPLSEGDVCGEELLTWCLEHSSVNKDVSKRRSPGHKLLSSRTVECLSNVEAFVLRAADLEEVTSLFARFLRNPHVQGAIRYESPYWRSIAATCIQVAWRYRKKRLGRGATSSPQSSTSRN